MKASCRHGCRAALLLELSSPAAAAQPALEAADAAEVVVQVSRSRAPRTAGSTSVRAAQAASSAGTQGDPGKVVASLPGVARAGATGGDLLVWGSTAAETGIYLDGVPLPALYHGSGIRSVIPASAVSRLTLLPGAFGAEHGRALGGIVALESAELAPEQAALELRADLLDAGARVAAPLSASLHASAAARLGYADRWLKRFSRADIGSLISVPRYWDGQLRASVHSPEQAERLDATLLASHDLWQREVPSSDPARRVREARELSFQRWYVRYVREQGEDVTELTPFLGLDVSRASARQGARGWGQAVRTWHYGLRGARQWPLNGACTLRLGLDALGSWSSVARRGTPTLPAREGDPRAFGQAPGREDARDDYTRHVLDLAPHAEAELSLGRLRLTPGLRADAYLLEVSRLRPRVGRVPAVGGSRALLVFEPRFAASYDLGRGVRLVGAAGLYHQAPAPEDASSVFGNPQLDLARAVHLSLGESAALTSMLTVEVTGYWKRLAQLPARNPAPAPDVAEGLLPLGQGRSYGTQLMLRQAPSHGWSGWLAWTMARSERRDGNGELRRFDHDQPHVLALVVQRRFSSWSFGARFRYASGSPYTPVVGASYDLQADRYEPIFGPRNSQRLPDFSELDLRADHWLRIGAARAGVYAEALNVLGTSHAEAIAYAADYRKRAYVTGLPPLLLLGLEVEW